MPLDQSRDSSRGNNSLLYLHRRLARRHATEDKEYQTKEQKEQQTEEQTKRNCNKRWNTRTKEQTKGRTNKRKNEVTKVDCDRVTGDIEGTGMERGASEKSFQIC